MSQVAAQRLPSRGRGRLGRRARGARTIPWKPSYLSHATLYNIVNNIPVDHLLVVLDTCHGGVFGATRGGDSGYSGLTDAEQIERVMRLKTGKFLTSGGNEYVSDGAPGAHSPFAYRLLEAWRRGGSGGSLLSYYELIDWVRQVRPSQPRWGNFGTDEPGSDFVFVRIGR